MIYTDEELRIATEIAYLDLHKVIDEIKGSAGEGIKVLDAINIFKVRIRGILSDMDNDRFQDILDFLNSPETEH